MLYNSPVKVYLSLLSCFILLFSFPSVVFAEDTFTYDANGNLVQDSASGRCFEYNGAHKLKKVTDCSGNTLAQYWYDDVGKKVKAVEGDVTTLYWSDEQVEVIGGPDHGNYTYFFANGERIARMNPNGSMYYYHNDHLGSTSVITDDQGNIVEKTKYYPYGEVRSGGNATAYLYNSKELDPITGQYDYRARPYDPTNPPRFTQPDPLLPDVYDPQSLNRYSYVKNNPLKYTDPTGHQGYPQIDLPSLYAFGSATAMAVANAGMTVVSSTAFMMTATVLMIPAEYNMAVDWYNKQTSWSTPFTTSTGNVNLFGANYPGPNSPKRPKPDKSGKVEWGPTNYELKEGDLKVETMDEAAELAQQKSGMPRDMMVKDPSYKSMGDKGNKFWDPQGGEHYRAWVGKPGTSYQGGEYRLDTGDIRFSGNGPDWQHFNYYNPTTKESGHVFFKTANIDAFYKYL